MLRIVSDKHGILDVRWKIFRIIPGTSLRSLIENMHDSWHDRNKPLKELTKPVDNCSRVVT